MTRFIKKTTWDSILPKLTETVKNDSRFKNGRKGSPRSLSFEFEDLTNTYLPPLIKNHMQNWFEATGHHDFADQGFYDDNENLITLNTKASSQYADADIDKAPCITHGICAFKPVFDYFMENKSNYYILIRYNTTERGGKTYILDTEAVPLHFIPVHDVRVTGVGWGHLMQSYSNPKKTIRAAERGEKRGRKCSLSHDIVWRGAPSTREWAEAVGQKASAMYERRMNTDQNRMQFFEERCLTSV